MLLLIGAVGLLLTIYQYRLPGIPFFCFITVFNRKQKLTDKGSKVYLVFFVMMVIGLLVSLTGSPRAPAAAPAATALSDPPAGGKVTGDYIADRDALAFREMVAEMVLSRKALFSVLLTAPEIARVREKFDDCEGRFRTGAERGPDVGIVAQAVKFCMRTAAQLCNDWPDPERNREPSPACAGLRQAHPELWYGLN